MSNPLRYYANIERCGRTDRYIDNDRRALLVAAERISREEHRVVKVYRADFAYGYDNSLVAVYVDGKLK